MFDQLSANALTAWLPNLTYTIPYFGDVDFTQIVSATIVFVALTAFFWLLRMVVLVRLRVLASKTSGTFDDLIVEVVQNIRAWVYSLVALFAALQFFTFPDLVNQIISGVFYFAIVWQVIEIATRFIDYFSSKFVEKDEDGDGEIDPNAATASSLITLISRIVLWVFGVIFVLSNIGIEVTSLIAGLGIGGVAIAFALQGVLGDLFASFSIYFDRPFRVGDFIVIGADMGTVEKIGVKSTRLRTLQGEELVVSNTELTTVRVQNFKKMAERRSVTQFGVTYETPLERLQEIPGIVERAFEALDQARLDRVHFASFGDSALIFEMVFFVETSDYAKFMDIQQKFNFDLMQRFAELGIEFAYPTQTIYHKQVS